MNVTSSARNYGMGGLNITNIDNDVANTDQNPALLDPGMSQQVALNYMSYLGGSNFAGLRYAGSANDRSTWSAGIRYFGYGSIKGADAQGNLTGTFAPKDLALNGALSYDIWGYWRGGVNIKFLYSNYERYTALALATDIGVNYYDPDRDLSLSVVAANLGGQIKKFNAVGEHLPADVRLGWAQSFGAFPVRFSVTAWNLTQWHMPFIDNSITTSGNQSVIKDSFSSNLMRHLIFGAELISSEKFYVTLGYNYKTRTDMSTYSRSMLSGFSLGVGLKVTNFQTSVAIAQPHTGATTFMFNVTTNLNDLIQ